MADRVRQGVVEGVRRIACAWGPFAQVVVKRGYHGHEMRAVMLRMGLMKLLIHMLRVVKLWVKMLLIVMVVFLLL